MQCQIQSLALWIAAQIVWAAGWGPSLESKPAPMKGIPKWIHEPPGGLQLHQIEGFWTWGCRGKVAGWSYSRPVDGCRHLSISVPWGQVARGGDHKLSLQDRRHLSYEDNSDTSATPKYLKKLFTPLGEERSPTRCASAEGCSWQGVAFHHAMGTQEVSRAGSLW